MSTQIDNPQGTDSSTVEAAASAFASLLDPPTEDTQADSEAQSEPESQDAEEEQAQGDEPEGESDDEDQAEDVEEEPRYRVKIAGEEVEVTLSEALKGYQRQSDYSRKTEELARLRREAEAQISSESEAIRAERQQYQQVLAALQNQLGQQEEQIDWDTLRVTDPIEYATKYAEHQQRKERLQAVQAEQQRLAQQQQYEQQVLMQQRLAQEQNLLLKALPEWSDKEVATREKRQIIDFAKSIGFSEEELAQAADHRAILALRDAMRYRQLMAKKPEVKPVQASPSVRPGASNVVRTKSALNEAKQRLARSGSVNDAAAAFQALLKG